MRDQSNRENMEWFLHKVLKWPAQDEDCAPFIKNTCEHSNPIPKGQEDLWEYAICDTCHTRMLIPKLEQEELVNKLLDMTDQIVDKGKVIWTRETQ